MTKAEFETLQPGDIVANEFGWQARIVRKVSYGYQTRPILGTGTRQELRSSKKNQGSIIDHARWARVSP